MSPLVRASLRQCVTRTAVLSAATALAVAGVTVTGATAAHARPAATWAPRPATYGVTVVRDVPVRMDDGVVLRADVRLPAQNGRPAAGRFPVLVTQTAYNKALPMLNMADDYLVERGYVQVIMDVRGTGDSPGQWDALGPREQHDGYDLVQWAASTQRPWSNGNVGLAGASYGGINQILTAAQHPAGLKAIFPVVPVGDVYRDVVGNGGQIDIGFMPLWLSIVGTTSMLPPTLALTDPTAALAALRAHAGDIGSFDVAMLRDALAGGDKAFDSSFYATRSPINAIDKVTVPTFLVGGEQDIFQRGEPLLYQHLSAHGVPAKFLYGPWTHAGAALPALGAPSWLDPGLVLQPGNSLQELQLRWFDHYLSGVDDPGIVDRAAVTYYENGAGSHGWQTATQWPPAGVRYRRFSLTGHAAAGSATGQLVDGAASSGGPDLAPHSPASGICTESTDQWTAGLLGILGFPCDNDQSGNDQTGLTYDLPVSGPLRLAGPIEAHLTVSTPSPDGQLTVRLEDVAPNGQVRQLSAGWQVLSLRQLDLDKSTEVNGLLVQPYHPYTRDSAHPMPANRPVPIDVEIFPTAAEIQPGHTLRLAIQTADFPHLAAPANQNAAGNASIRIWHSAADPSWVVLPTLS